MSDDYEVGRGKPPKHSRFRKGQSGNAKGRPKKSRNFNTDLDEVLDQPVTLNENGKTKTVSSQLAALKRLREKALNGDARALDRLLALAVERSAELEARQSDRTLQDAEADILASFKEMIRKEALNDKAPEESAEQ